MDQYPQQTPPTFPQPGFTPPPSATSQPQPGYPPPGYSTQPPRRSRIGIWVVSLLVIVLLVGGYFYLHQQNGPTATLNQYCDGFLKGDAHEMYDTFSASYLAQDDKQNEQEFQKTLDERKKSNNVITACTVNNVQQNGSIATGTITFTGTSNGQLKTSSAAFTLVQENGQWKINDIGSEHDIE